MSPVDFIDKLISGHLKKRKAKFSGSHVELQDMDDAEANNRAAEIEALVEAKKVLRATRRIFYFVLLSVFAAAVLLSCVLGMKTYERSKDSLHVMRVGLGVHCLAFIFMILLRAELSHNVVFCFAMGSVACAFFGFVGGAEAYKS